MQKIENKVCDYCRSPFEEEDNIKKTRKYIYHQECWEQKTETKEELNFD